MDFYWNCYSLKTTSRFFIFLVFSFSVLYIQVSLTITDLLLPLKKSQTLFLKSKLRAATNRKKKFSQPYQAVSFISFLNEHHFCDYIPISGTNMLRNRRKMCISCLYLSEAFTNSATQERRRMHNIIYFFLFLSAAYQGCFRDRKPGRDLPKQFTKYEMTPEWCVGKCKLAGYSYAGLQYGYLCFCGDKFGKYGRAEDRDCDSLCFGDKTRYCGSFWHNSIFAVGEDILKQQVILKEE